MRIGTGVKAMLAALPLAMAGLTGCGDFWQAPGGGGGGGCTTNCSTATSGNFYILNTGTNPEILGYSIVSGTLTAITGSPYTLGSPPLSIAVSGSYLYVGTSAGIYVYTVGSNGSLTLGNSSQAISTDIATTMQLDSTGAWLLEAGPNLAELIAIPIDTSTGLVPSGATEKTAALPADTVHQLAISPDNANVFVALGANGTEVVPFTGTTASSANPFGATETNIKVKNAGGSAVSVAIDPNSSAPRLFYVGEVLGNTAASAGGLRVFNYASLTTLPITEVTGSPYSSGGLAPNAILPASTGDYVYVANGQGTTSAGNISEFAVTATGSVYSLTAGTTAAVGTLPVGLAEDSTDTFILAVSSSGSPYLSAFTIDSTTAGKLDSQFTANTGASPVAIAAQ